MPQLICRDLALGYEGKTVVSELSFTVNAGDYLCVVGENGTGKSTLMKTILKLKTPLSGEIQINDGLSANEIGYLPQQTVIQKDFPASVREVVRSGCLNRCGLRPFYNKAEKQMAEDNMEKLGIAPLAKSCYRELSGGQQQRALLARALCAARKILLLDEPAAGLDPNAAAEMYALIEKLNGGGITVIMISHDVAACVKYASHILHIGAGSALFFGTKADYLKSEAGCAYAETGEKT
ncbi:MAG: ATP-binding cassette domain-containing protein [Oscillospiraceae bacterium]|jgi:zinc transport system ATP-binding protein|nr:ATP-binding cassette domain-containing protein [Oscillospiraceae bacterium]